MTDRLSCTGAGLVLHDEHGKQLAAITVVFGERESKLLMTGQWPAEITPGAEHWKHLSAIAARAQRNTFFPPGWDRPSLPKPVAATP